MQINGGNQITCCTGCKPPRRCADPNCHATCKEYLEQKAERDKWLEESFSKKELDYKINQVRHKSVIKAKQRGIERKKSMMGDYNNE